MTEMEHCQQNNGAGGDPGTPLNNKSPVAMRGKSGRSQGRGVTWSSSTRSSKLSSRSPDFHALHKSATNNILEILGHESKCILLLPYPYDSFTRDLVNLLKTIFTAEGNIPSTCCFDPDVIAQYSSDKSGWIERTLSDSKKIVIFLCLTSIDENSTSDCVVDNLLNQCKIERDDPKCHVLFLHVTDNVKDLENRYHGTDIHVKHENALESFLSAILQACGKDTDSDQDVLEAMLESDAVKHLLKFIGHS